ncbi:MAG: hypothetical protein ACOYN2_04920 [Patescibacteria group bacterium]
MQKIFARLANPRLENTPKIAATQVINRTQESISRVQQKTKTGRQDTTRINPHTTEKIAIANGYREWGALDVVKMIATTVALGLVVKVCGHYEKPRCTASELNNHVP